MHKLHRARAVPSRRQAETTEKWGEPTHFVSYQKNGALHAEITHFKGFNHPIKFFANLVVCIISLVALIILIDTLKEPLINIFPGSEIILLNLFETLQDIKLFIIDLFN